MTDAEIIGRLAREKVVERIAGAVVPGVKGADFADLCQIIYVALLEKPPGRIREAARDGWLPFLVAAIARRQVHGNRTEFRRLKLPTDDNGTAEARQDD